MPARRRQAGKRGPFLIFVTLNRLYLFQNFPNGMASALGSDNDA